MKSITDNFPILSTKQKEQFASLGELYQSWNEKINVISRKDMEHLYTHHILHSLAIAKFVEFQPEAHVLDVGTGGGFPGIPLAILFPDTRFHLVDSVGKKITVVNEVASSIGLKNVLAEKSRAEELLGEYDFVVSRAVAPISELLNWTSRLIRKGGTHTVKNGWILLKGGDLTDEIKQSHRKAEVLDLSNWFQEDFFLTKKLVYISA